MGVTGCGKTTIGRLLADALSLPFIDADDHHPEQNIDKMSQGIPLTDEDRQPWLQKLAFILRSEQQKKGIVLACSALKESYRSLLQSQVKESITWICLEGSEQIIRERMKNRKDHFMPETLLHSQLTTLEKPQYAHCVSIDAPPGTIVEEILRLVRN